LDNPLNNLSNSDLKPNAPFVTNMSNIIKISETNLEESYSIPAGNSRQEKMGQIKKPKPWEPQTDPVFEESYKSVSLSSIPHDTKIDCSA
jgi:hypothetical protein